MWYRFPRPIVVEVSGKDAERYLNNRLSNDIRQCQINHPIIAAALNPQGRVEGIFTVFRKGDGAFILVCDGGNPTEVISALSRYIVADRVTINNVTELFAWIHVAQGIDVVALQNDNREHLELNSHTRIFADGADILVPMEAVAHVVKVLSGAESGVISDDEYRALRVARGLPVFPEELNAHVILSECGMRHAISFSKGCYVGQEVIERSDAIGKLPRRLERFVFDHLTQVEIGATIENVHHEAIGKVVTTTHSPKKTRTLAFAMMKTGKYEIGERALIGTATGTIVALEGELQ